MNKFLEKTGIWLAGIAVSVAGYFWTGVTNRIQVVEDRVSHLYQDKVSRQELKEEMAIIRSQNEQNKQDIISRLELILKMYAKDN